MTTVVESRRLILECPECATRFELKRYEPERRVVCRKCRAVVQIPVVDELLSAAERAKFAAGKPPDPEVQRKVAKILSLRKLALLTLAMLMGVAGAALILFKRAQAPKVAAAPQKPKEVLDLKKLASQNRLLEYPMGVAWEWAYAVGEQQETRRAVAQSLSPSGEPQFEIAILGPAGGVRQVVRLAAEGAVMLEEARPEGRFRFDPPIPFCRFPLYDGDAWTYEGQCTRDGGGTELWKLDFKVSIEAVEKLPIRAGKVGASRVTCTGTRGTQAFAESLWYVKGVGIVQRETVVEGQTQRAILTRYAQPQSK